MNSWQLPAMTGTPPPRRQREWGRSWHARPRHTTFALAALSISHVNRTLNPPSRWHDEHLACIFETYISR